MTLKLRPVLGVAVLLAILLLGGGVMAVLYALFRAPDAPRRKPLTESQWHLLRPPRGGCAVLMPGTPGVFEVRERGTRYWSRLMEEQCEFVLFCGTPRPGLGVEDIEKLLRIDRDNMLRIVPQGRVTRDESVSLYGCPGQEVEINGPNGMVCLVRGFLVGKGSTKRLYELRIGGFDLRPDAGDAARFFDSFRLEGDDSSPAPKQPTPAGGKGS
jgi:hypothetical protein